jgi:hypothetical protein
MYTDDPLDHIYKDADTNLQCPSESATNAVQVRNICNVIIYNETSCLHSFVQEAAAYEIPREELFDIAGLYVPTIVSQSA